MKMKRGPIRRRAWGELGGPVVEERDVLPDTRVTASHLRCASPHFYISPLSLVAVAERTAARANTSVTPPAPAAADSQPPPRFLIDLIRETITALMNADSRWAPAV